MRCNCLQFVLSALGGRAGEAEATNEALEADFKRAEAGPKVILSIGILMGRVEMAASPRHQIVDGRGGRPLHIFCNLLKTVVVVLTLGLLWSS